MIGIASIQKKDGIRPKQLIFLKHFVRNNFLGQKLKTKESFQRLSKKKNKRIVLKQR